MLKNIKKVSSALARKLGTLLVCGALALSTAQAAFADPQNEDPKQSENSATLQGGAPKMRKAKIPRN